MLHIVYFKTRHKVSKKKLFIMISNNGMNDVTHAFAVQTFLNKVEIYFFLKPQNKKF